MSNLKMSWNDRFAVINHFKPTDAQVTAAFGVSHDELETARGLLSAGTFAPTPNLDMGRYDGVFAAAAAAPQLMPSVASSTATSVVKPTMSAVTTKQGNATSYAKPETASRKAKEPQKRGRKGDKIATALSAVPMERTNAEEFAKQHNVSIAVLRQSKRFLEQMTPEQRAAIGTICVRQDKDTRTLMIWREKPAA